MTNFIGFRYAVTFEVESNTNIKKPELRLFRSFKLRRADNVHFSIVYCFQLSGENPVDIVIGQMTEYTNM